MVCAATAMLMLDIAVVNTALSRIAEDLDTGLSGLQWVVDAYTLALASVVLTAGSLADRFGRRRLFTIGLAVFTAASAACAASTDIVFLDAARAVQGIGAAIMFAVSLALLANAYPDMKERAGALAAYGATIGASFAIGPLVGGALTSGLDWQWIFLINIPIGIFCLWITRTKVQESRDPATPPVDVPGQIALTAGLFLLVLALLRGNDVGWGSTQIVAEFAGAAVALVAFLDHRGALDAPDAPAAPVPQPVVHGRADRGLRDLGVVLRDLPLRDALPAAGARAVGHRGRPRLPARHDPQLRRRRREQPGRREGPAPDHDLGRARPGRHRHGPLHAGGHRLVVDRSSCPASSSRSSASACSTRRSSPSPSARRRRSRAALPPA